MSKFLETITAMRDGKVVSELEKQLAEVIASVYTTGKPGNVNLKITVRPMKNAEPGMIFLADEIKVTLPKLDKTATFFYASSDGKVSRRDPRQPEIELLPGEVTRPRAVSNFPPPAAESGS